jgi:hypothetical protein
MGKGEVFQRTVVVQYYALDDETRPLPEKPGFRRLAK